VLRLDQKTEADTDDDLERGHRREDPPHAAQPCGTSSSEPFFGEPARVDVGRFNAHRVLIGVHRTMLKVAVVASEPRTPASAGVRVLLAAC
jgi:hypothetical protein